MITDEKFTEEDKKKMLEAALTMAPPMLDKAAIAQIKWIVQQSIYRPPAWPLKDYLEMRLGPDKFFDWKWKTLLFSAAMTITFFITWVILQ